ncbi:MAG: amidophosphoribosyltransferase, partial [Candidatus Accumulibacter sp.]|nr:amidophosphoribosyltransferase [Accumulibacter sp.]
ELIATGRSEAEIALEIGADALIYQDLEALKASVREINPRIDIFDCSCFDGRYVTGDITASYLNAIERARECKSAAAFVDDGDSRQLDLNLKTVTR